MHTKGTVCFRVHYCPEAPGLYREFIDQHENADIAFQVIQVASLSSLSRPMCKLESSAWHFYIPLPDGKPGAYFANDEFRREVTDHQRQLDIINCGRGLETMIERGQMEGGDRSQLIADQNLLYCWRKDDPSAMKMELMSKALAHKPEKRSKIDEMVRECGHKVLRFHPYHWQYNRIELVRVTTRNNKFDDVAL
uniref:Uncharacterized protein n=1 Tax=Timema douglasi TaxID=61478 RepID=A0A7R8ZHP5_TIMDO|nr:unnamed protein product [Timema douglasi]